MSNLEKQVRELDILDKPIKEIAIAAANIFNLSFEYCKKILQIKRAGFTSNYEYLQHLAKKNHFGLNKTDPRYAYVACLSVLRKNKLNSNKHRWSFCFPNQYCEEQRELEKKELAQKMQNLISNLPKTEAEVIQSRYYLNQTRTEIAKRFDTSKQRIEQIEKVALETLYFKAKEHNLQEYIE